MNKFLLYVATKGRPSSCPTIEKLYKEGNKNLRIIVEPQDQEDYCQEFPEASIITLPENDKGITYARNYILTEARRLSISHFWMLDDDIKSMGVVFEKKCIPKAFYSEVFWDAEQDMLKTKTAISSMEYSQYAWSCGWRVSYNSYCDVANLIDVEQTKYINYREDCKEDRDFVLQILSNGMKSCRHTKYFMTVPKNGSNKGGLYDWYSGGHEKHWSAKMVKLWPGVCQQVIKKDGRPDVKINWKQFKTKK